MARTPKNIVVDINDQNIDEAKVGQAMEAHREEQGALTVANQEKSKRVTALAAQLNYNGSTDPAVLENSAKDAIRRIGAGIFELGAYLLLLRETSKHGHFLPALERLQLEPRAAQRYMEISRRFANASAPTHLAAIGMAKLVELLPLDDEQLGELTELGQTGELALDDLTSMSMRDLRAKVRELNAEKDASEQLLEKKNAKIDKLEREKRLIQRQGPDEEYVRLQKEAAELVSELRGLVCGSLRQALIAINAHGEEGNTSLMAGILGQVQSDLSALRDELDIPDVGATPEWQQWAKDQATTTGKPN